MADALSLLVDAVPVTKWGWVGWLFAFTFAVSFSCAAGHILVSLFLDRRLSRDDFSPLVVFSVSAIGLWWLSVYLWSGTLIILFICAGLVFAAASLFLLIESGDAKKRAEKLFFINLGVLTLVMSVVSLVSIYFKGLGWLFTVPGTVAGFVVSIPLGVWSGTIMAAALLTLLFNWRLEAFTEMLWRSQRRSGEDFVQSHVWRDERGFTFGPATRQQVYEHYHGQGSWFGAVSFLEGASRFFAFVVPIVLPLAIIWIAGWYRIWSIGGLLLTAILTAISIAGKVRFARWRERIY